MTRRRIGRAVWLPCHQEPATSMVPAFAPARRGRYRLPPALLLAAHSRSRAVILEDPVPGPGHHSGSQRRDLARLVNGFARLLASLGGVTSRPRCVCAGPPKGWFRSIVSIDETSAPRGAVRRWFREAKRGNSPLPTVPGLFVGWLRLQSNWLGKGFRPVRGSALLPPGFPGRRPGLGRSSPLAGL